MVVFGPHYPRELQLVVDHAERFCDLLTRVEANTVPGGLGRAWLSGRIDEIAAVLDGLVGDWRSGRLSEEAASRAASAYLHVLHIGARQRLSLDAELEGQCCEGDLAPTVLWLTDDDVTEFLDPADAAAVDDAETYFDPRSLLDGFGDLPIAAHSADSGSAIEQRLGPPPQDSRKT